ncbi:MAG: hypothetical protein P4L53_22520 [Candidatus Obscuribacterales bacterium]|nr:hypothetical protein [Candidatus Obscuribacterales bacterium]
MTLLLVLALGLSLTACNEEKHSRVEPTVSTVNPQYDPKTGVKLDTRTLPPTSAHKAIYKPETEAVVVVGEVVDAWCYASQTMGAGHGPVHQACAVACVGGGVTPGILDDTGMLWLCVKHKAFTGCKEILFPFVARRVKVTGWAAHKGGCNVLKVEKVELVAPTSGAASSPAPGTGSGATEQPSSLKKNK